MSNSLNADDVFALLEAGPQSQSDLVIWLSRPTLDDVHNERLVRHELGRLKRAGQVKRVGLAGRWALASYVAPNGRPPALVHKPRVRTPRARVAPPVRPPPGLSLPLTVKPTLETRYEDGQSVTIRVIDGVAYEVFDLDHLIKRKDAARELDTSTRGSSLSWYEMGLSVRR